MFFSNTHWPQLTAPFYSILFETSICQFNSSKCSPIMSDEVRERPWQEIRDHSFIQNHSRPFRFSASSLQFTHSSSTGFRSEDWNAKQKLGFVLSDPIFSCFWGLSLYYCPVGRSKHGPLYLNIFEVPVVSDNWIYFEFVFGWARIIFLKPSQTTCGDVGAVWLFF